MSANIDYINYVRIQWLWLLCLLTIITDIMSAHNDYINYVCLQWLLILCLHTMIIYIMSGYNDYGHFVCMSIVNFTRTSIYVYSILYYLVQPVGSLFKRMENWFLSAHLNSVSLYITFITFSKYMPQG